MTQHYLKVLRGKDQAFRELEHTVQLQDRDIIYTEKQGFFDESMAVFRELEYGLTTLTRKGPDQEISISAGFKDDLHTDEKGLARYIEATGKTIHAGTTDNPNPEYDALNAELTKAQSRVEKVLGRKLK